MTRVVVVGAAGRMGRSMLRLLGEFPDLTLTAAVASGRSAALGQDAGSQAGAAVLGVPVTADLAAALVDADVVIDFSTAAAAAEHVRACAQARVPLLLGTTGLPEGLEGVLGEAAKSTAVLVAANTSLGINVLLELVRQAAAALPDYDLEIVEVHHRHKVDAPSGTALALGRAAAEGRQVSLAEQAAYARQGHTGPRPAGQIGFAVVRGGDVVGEHDVLLLAGGERLRLGHVATDRAVFARGALTTARWLAQQRPGRYAMRDVFLAKTKS